ncbi:MAG: hypothetical protein CMN84_04490 [Spongiibacteraceae bacterium]|jgi:hypothetical protein|nr:hypothetical protein [Spongiibacteraceae bacterium]
MVSTFCGADQSREVSRINAFFFTLFFLMVAGKVYSNDLAIGEWYQYHKRFFGDYGFFHLELTEESGGEFTYKFYDGEPRSLSFRASDVTFSDGFVAINLDSHIKINLAASKDVRLTGTMWFYNEEDGLLSTTNYFFLELAAVYEGEKTDSLEQIRTIIKKLASAQNGS